MSDEASRQRLNQKVRGNATLARAINTVLRPFWRMRRGMTPVSYTHLTLPTTPYV